MATYYRDSNDSYEDFVADRAVLESNGISVLSGEWADNVLTIKTDIDVPMDLLNLLNLKQG
jgi:hypothetical protein